MRRYTGNRRRQRKNNYTKILIDKVTTLCYNIATLNRRKQNEFIRLCLYWTRCGGICTRNNDSDHRTRNSLNTNDNTRGCAMC